MKDLNNMTHQELIHYTHQLERKLNENNTDGKMLYSLNLKMKAHDAMYQRLIQTSPEGFWLIDKHRKTLDVNNSLLNLLGYSRDEMLGKTPFDFVDETNKAVFIKQFKNAESENKRTYEVVLKKKDGSDLYTLINATAVCDEEGVFAGSFAFVSDITDVKQSETTIRNLNQFRDSIVENANVWINVLDKQARVVMWNKAAENISGFSAEDVIGHVKIWEWLYPDEHYRTEIFTKASEIIEKGDIVEGFETTITTKSGKQKTISWYSKYFSDTEDDSLGSIAIGLDITEKKHIEKELGKMEKLKSVGLLAGGIAHDFNNILTGIYANISLFKEKAENAQNLELLDEAEKSIERAIKLTQQLLTFSKGGSPVKEDLDIETLVRDVVSFDLSGSSVRPEFSIQNPLWNVIGDRGQLEQVFSNLTVNAKQASPQGSCLFITMENVFLKHGNQENIREGCYLKIIVRDEGEGISKEYIDRIFDPYFTTKTGGSGLGLSIIYSIVKAHNGYIQVDSAKGKGTAFTVYLPAEQDQNIREEAAPDDRQHSPSQGGKILVMDDDDVICSTLTDILEFYGCYVKTVGDGKQAIEEYRYSLEACDPYDILIMDLTVPGGMGGKEAAEHILELNPEARLVVSSGYSNDPVMSDHRQYGFKAILRKPYTIKEIRNMLNEVL